MTRKHVCFQTCMNSFQVLNTKNIYILELHTGLKQLEGEEMMTEFSFNYPFKSVCVCERETDFNYD